VTCTFSHLLSPPPILLSLAVVALRPSSRLTSLFPLPSSHYSPFSLLVSRSLAALSPTNGVKRRRSLCVTFTRTCRTTFSQLPRVADS
jgi:hypothetical protein